MVDCKHRSRRVRFAYHPGLSLFERVPMARVAIDFEAYSEGRLPGICVISGQPTNDVFSYRVELPPESKEGGQDMGKLVARLETFLASVDARRPRRILLGRIPLDRHIRDRLRRTQRLWSAVLAVSIVALIAAAWAAAPWSPLVAALSIGAIAISVRKRPVWDQALPRPFVTHGGRSVTLEGVHEDFASAVQQNA